MQMRVPVSATGRRGEAAHLLRRFEGVADLIPLHERRSEEPLDRAVERGGVVEWDHYAWRSGTWRAGRLGIDLDAGR
jgi:hypothetical protein